MPIYSYHCAKCGKNFEVLIGMSEKAVCPTCNSKKLERVYARVVKKKKQPGKSRTLAKAAPAKRRAQATPAPAKKIKRTAKRTARR